MFSSVHNGIASINLKTMLGALRSTLLLFCVVWFVGGCTGNRDRPLQMVKGADPQYPQEARRAGVEGYVTVSYSVSKEGLVNSVTVVESQPAGVFDAAAIAAVQRWRYKAPQRDGQPMAVERVTSTLRFTLASSEEASKYDDY